MKFRPLSLGVAFISLASFTIPVLPAQAAGLTTAALSHPSPSAVTHAGGSNALHSETATTSTILISDDPNNTTDEFVEVSPKKQTKNVTAFVFDLTNDGKGSTALVQSMKFIVSTSSAPDSPAVDITSLISKATINGVSGTINTDNTISFSFPRPIKIAKNATKVVTIVVNFQPQKGNYADQGESVLFSVHSDDVLVTDSKTGQPDRVQGSNHGGRLSLSTHPGINLRGTSTSAVLTYNAVDPSKSYGTFTVNFTVNALGGDIYVPRSIASSTAASATAGTVLDLNMISYAAGTTSEAINSTADVDNPQFWVIHEGETDSFTATAFIDPLNSGYYQVGLDQLRFSATDEDFLHLQTLNVYDGDPQFHTDPLYIPNS